MVAERTGSRYDDFLDLVHQLSDLDHASRVLSWDQEVMMPEGGAPARSRQLSTLDSLRHDLLTGEEMESYLETLTTNAGTLTDDQRAVVREIRRRHERNSTVSNDLVEDVSRATSEAVPEWREAKEADDFGAVSPTFERVVELKREYAAQIDPDADPYAVLFAEFEPYLDLETVERVLGDLRDELVPLVEAVQSSDVTLTTREQAFPDSYDAGALEDLVRDAYDLLGFPWDRGRLDPSSSPGSTGSQFDARVTLRFDGSDPFGALLGGIHEFGHASYRLGVPDEHYGTPLGDTRDFTVHEAQARLWENHVGRSEAWWDAVLPAVRERFPATEEPSSRTVYEAANRVHDDDPIRVRADELTYHLHIVVRFEIERDLVRGDLAVGDVPRAWNEKMAEYLGVRPEGDADGCLQDSHWAYGSFGYFPTYSLGSVLAAQLYAAADDDVDDLAGNVRAGDFEPLREWLREHVSRHGRRYTTPELVERATGDALTADYFLDYAKAKFGDLYEL